MVKKLLLTAGDDDYEWYIEKTRNGYKYYTKLIGTNEYTPVSEKEMRDAVRSDVEEYGVIRYYHWDKGRWEENRENFMRVRKLAPWLLPKLVALWDNETSLKVVPEKDFCPPGYDFVPVKKPKKLKNGDTIRGYCKLIR